MQLEQVGINDSHSSKVLMCRIIDQDKVCWLALREVHRKLIRAEELSLTTLTSWLKKRRVTQRIATREKNLFLYSNRAILTNSAKVVLLETEGLAQLITEELFNAGFGKSVSRIPKLTAYSNWRKARAVSRLYLPGHIFCCADIPTIPQPLTFPARKLNGQLERLERHSSMLGHVNVAQHQNTTAVAQFPIPLLHHQYHQWAATALLLKACID